MGKGGAPIYSVEMERTQQWERHQFQLIAV